MGSDFPLTNSEWTDACRQTLELRGDESTGWSTAWKICAWARLLDGDRAHKLLRNLLEVVQSDKSGETNYHKRGTYINLFCAHPPFQIDGNFGGTAGIAEMLLQSQNRVLHLLPALLSAWRDGQVKGLKARGNFTVDMKWQASALARAVIISHLGGLCRIRSLWPLEIQGASLNSEASGLYFTYELDTDAGQKVRIKRTH